MTKRIITNKGGIKARTEVIYSHGLQDLFEKSYVGEYNAVAVCQKVIRFKIEHNRDPSRVSKNEDERKLGNWLHHVRNSKQGTGKNLLYPILDSMAIEAGFPDMFNNIDRQRIACEICHELIQFKIEHSRNPNQNSINVNERKLGTWLSNMRKRNQIGKCYCSSIKIATDVGLPNMFNSKWKDDLK